MLLNLLTSIISLIIYYLSYKNYKEENYKSAIFYIILGGAILRIYTSLDLFIHPWDERYHALVAKNLIKHPLIPTLYDNPILPYNYTNWTANHIWLHKLPIPLLTIALSLYLFGINEIAIRIPSILFSTLGIYLTFYIARYITNNNKISYLSAFLFSINGLIIELTAGRVATDHIDISFMFFIEISIFLIIKFLETKKDIYNLLSGISLGFAILSKWLPALIVVPIYLLLALDSKKFTKSEIFKSFFVFFIFFSILPTLWHLYIFLKFPLEAKDCYMHNIRHFTEKLDNLGSGPFYYIKKIRVNYGELIYLPLFYFTFNKQNYYNMKNIILLIWFWIPTIFFSLSKTQMQGYILFTSPALFLITAIFYYYVKYKYKNLFVKVILILLILLPVRYSLERTKILKKTNRNPEWAVKLKSFKGCKDNNDIIFNYPYPIEAMFYTECSAYPEIPSNQIIEELKKDKRKIFIYSNGEFIKINN